MLNLSRNQIGDKGARSLAEVLQDNKVKIFFQRFEFLFSLQTLINLQLIDNQISKPIQRELKTRDSRILTK